MRLQFARTLAGCALALALAAACAKKADNQNGGAASQPPANTATTQPAAPAQATTNAPAAGQPVVAGQPAGANAAGQPGAPPAPAGASATARRIDACTLLNSDDIKAVQGEAVKTTTPSQRDDQRLVVSQCFYTTPTFTKSVSVEVTQTAPGAASTRDFWEQRFTRAEAEAREKEREREKKGEKKKESPPTPIKGIGEGAYWASSGVNGTLYVLKGDAILRVSIGGTDTDAQRLTKTKALAQRALARL